MTARLDTLLGKALVEERLLGPQALEDALQQHVLHGGALDTVLLELGSVPEATLAPLLAKAWGTPAVDVDELSRLDPAAAKSLPARMALAMRLCPLRVDGDALHVLSAAPLDRALIDEVAALIGRRVVPRVVPEVRLWQALAKAYGVPVEERYVALLAQLGASTSKLPAVVPPAPAPSKRGDHDAVDWDLVDALAHLAAAENRDAIAKVAVDYARRFLPFAAMFGVRGDAAVGWHRAGPCEGAQFEARAFAIPRDCFLHGALTSPSPLLGRPPINDGNAAFLGWLGRRRPRTLLVVPVVVAKRCVAMLVGDGGIKPRDFAELSDLVAFGARLGSAFEALLRARHRAHPSLVPASAAAAPVETTTAKWRVPITPPAPAPDAEAALRDGTSPFARAYQPPPKKPDDDDAAPAIARLRPPTQPFLPAAPRILAAAAASTGDARDRLRTDPMFKVPVAGGVFPAVAASGPAAEQAWHGALVDVVERGVQGGVDDAPAPIFVDDEEGWENVVLDAVHAAELAPTRTHAPPDDDDDDEEPLPLTARKAPAATAAPVPAPPPTTTKPPDVLVDELAARDPFTVAAARRDLMALGEKALPALTDRFPGRMLCDVFDPSRVVKRPEDVSPLLDVLHHLGPPGLDAGIPHLDSRYPAHRYAAVLLFAATPDVRAIELLRPRLGDQEPRIRELAAEALLPFVAHPRFEAVLAHLRERLHAPVLEARRRAAVLLGTFRDVGAVPDLIAMLDEKGGELAHELRTALRPITLQDFGTRGKAWQRWWAKAKRKSRMDWLIDGLSSDDRDLRAQALVELEQLTGDSFGYKPDDPKKQRDRAVEVFQHWWKEERVRLAVGSR